MKKFLLLLSSLVMLVLCVSGCTNAAYNMSYYFVGYDEGKEDKVTFINSVSELDDYYKELKEHYEQVDDPYMNRMEEEVFLNEKYDDSYFEGKCLLLIYHYFTEQPEFKIESVVSKDDVLTVNILKSRYANLANAPTHFVIELDKEYSGMEVELKWETKDF